MLMVAMGRVTTSLEIPKRLFRRPKRPVEQVGNPKNPVSTVRKGGLPNREEKPKTDEH